MSYIERLEPRKRIRRIGIIAALIFIAATAAAGSFLPWWRDIDMALQGVQSRVGDYTQDTAVSVTIRGRHQRYLFRFFRNDRFEGSIEIEGLNGRLSNISLYFYRVGLGQHGQGQLSRLEHRRQEIMELNGTVWPVIEQVGRIYTRRDFSQVLLVIFAHGGERDIIIAAPAGDRVRATDIMINLVGYIGAAFGE